MDEGTRIITITNILDLLNLENGSNYKLAILKRCSDNELLERVLKMAYDRVSYTYGITMKNITYTPESGRPISLVQALDILETEFCTRKVTGNAAKVRLEEVLNNLSKEHAIIIEKILGRDLKINLGRTLINKVFPGLIVKPAYMRCDVYSAKTSKNIKFPAIVQLKCDGRFCSAIVDGGKATFVSRSGEEQEFPELAKTFTMLQDGVYIGELLVRGETDRALSNGMINSLLPPHDRIYMICWDYITPEEYINSKGKNTTTYKDRFEKLQSILNKPEFSITRDVEVVPYLPVCTLKEALEQTSKWMNEGYEGAILKDFSNVFKDGTSKTQLKLKIAFSLDVRVIGFIEGNKGTKREKTFGSIIYESDDKKITGSVSGFTDSQLIEINSRREFYLNKIMEIEGNDLTKSQSKETYAISHPRFIEFRLDKDYCDNLQRALDNIEMAKCLQ